jgi:TetR/AcrR family transcriptional regulator, biofilm operon repressor
MNLDLSSKEKVVDAAVKLFNTHGFDGTSVREIANEAGVNVSLISYYFHGKKGLLEYLMSSFLEGFLGEIEQIYQHIEEIPVKDSLIKMIDNLLGYQQDNYQVARFVHREITIDSTLIREVMSSYFMKERFYLHEILNHGMKRKEFNRLSAPFVCMQLRNLITAPFLNPQYLQEVYQLAPYDPYFMKNYKKLVYAWVENTLISTKYVPEKLNLPVASVGTGL